MKLQYYINMILQSNNSNFIIKVISYNNLLSKYDSDDIIYEQNNIIEDRNTYLEDIEHKYKGLNEIYEEQKGFIVKLQEEIVTLKSNSYSDDERNQSCGSHGGRSQRHSRNLNPRRPYQRRGHLRY